MNSALKRMKKSIKMLEGRKGRGVQLCLSNEDTILMMKKVRDAGSVEAFLAFKRPLLVQSLDAARLASQP